MAESNENQILSSAKETATILGIQNSTLRKYCQMLEKSGYRIHKNDLGHRGFFPKDIALIKRIINVSKSSDMTLDVAISSVLSTLDEPDKSESDTTEIAESPYITKDEFEEYQRKQAEMQKALYEKQSELIKDLVGRLERQEEFNKRIHEKTKEQEQKLLEKQIEEEKKAENEVAASNLKNPWWKFWG